MGSNGVPAIMAGHVRVANPSPRGGTRTLSKWVETPLIQGAGMPLKTAAGSGYFLRRLLLQADALEALVEAGELAAGLVKPVLAADPGRMRFRIDIEMERLAGFPVG